MPYYLSAEATFSAAHTLPNGGDCSRMHGHNWRVRVTVRVEEAALDPSTGMGVDFRILERALRDAVSDFDHQYLNELDPFAEHAPSAEHVSRIVCDRVAGVLEPSARVDAVEVWEMPEYRVLYRPA
jgi:6-pyruvoyltetrahydropterin/6-carboxytetrahydropterin synthase